MIFPAGIVFQLVIFVFLLKKSITNNKFLPLAIYVIIALFDWTFSSIVDIWPDRFSGFVFLTEPCSMLYGLLIYIYVRNLRSKELKLIGRDFLYLIPFVLSLLTYLPFYFQPASVKVSELSQYLILTDVIDNIWEWNFEIIVNCSFLGAALYEWKRYNSAMKESYSDLTKIDLKLTQILIGLALITYLTELIFVFSTYYGFPYYQHIFNIYNVLHMLILTCIGVDAIRNTRHLEDISKEDLNEGEEQTTSVNEKYLKSSLTKDDSENFKNQLIEFVIGEKPYLNSQLRLKDLASMLDMSTHHLSQIINESLNKNFYEFINYYRIEEAKELLNHDGYKNFTLSAIGYEVGFNSKSSFYNSFKKYTGKTPAKYLEELNQLK